MHTHPTGMIARNDTPLLSVSTESARSKDAIRCELQEGTRRVPSVCRSAFSRGLDPRMAPSAVLFLLIGTQSAFMHRPSCRSSCHPRVQRISAAVTGPARNNTSRPRLQDDDRDEPSFADPSNRIAQTVHDMKLPVMVELLRSRLPEGYSPRRPLWDTAVDTQHTLEVVVGALLALTDGKLSKMQEAAAPGSEEVARINQAMVDAKRLGGKVARSAPALDD